jgi:catechol 2,3-dioxygenase-like lactoylglutathione lyase family enzyme
MLLKKIEIETGAFQENLSFYRDILQFDVHSDGIGTEFSIHTGSSIISFKKITGSPVYHFAFNIPANKIEEACIWLQQRTELLWLEDSKSYIANFVNWNARSVYFFDPAGNIVEFISRFDLKDDEDEMFSPSQIRCVSEIGLVFPRTSFDKKANELLSAYSLQYFSKQPPLDHFRAIGDEQGLFIVVPENRSWYPTSDTPSGIYPLGVQFAIDQQEFSFRYPAAS